jgi:hypothetical protein
MHRIRCDWFGADILMSFSNIAAYTASGPANLLSASTPGRPDFAASQSKRIPEARFEGV